MNVHDLIEKLNDYSENLEVVFSLNGKEYHPVDRAVYTDVSIDSTGVIKKDDNDGENHCALVLESYT